MNARYNNLTKIDDCFVDPAHLSISEIGRARTLPRAAARNKLQSRTIIYVEKPNRKCGIMKKVLVSDSRSTIVDIIYTISNVLFVFSVFRF